MFLPFFGNLGHILLIFNKSGILGVFWPFWLIFGYFQVRQEHHRQQQAHQQQQQQLPQQAEDGISCSREYSKVQNNRVEQINIEIRTFSLFIQVKFVCK